MTYSQYNCPICGSKEPAHNCDGSDIEHPPHQHRFTVAVEWVETRYSKYTVTKLRCETCSEEVARG